MKLKSVKLLGRTFKILYKPFKNTKGRYDTSCKTIWINPHQDDEEKRLVLIHELAEIIANYLFAIIDDKSGRTIELKHNPASGHDNFTTFIHLLVDAIDRNKI